jgi:glycosyltransferase involved in cell wall biosynthesis
MGEETIAVMTAIEAKPAGKKIRILFVSHSPHFFGAEQSLLCLLRGIDRSRFEPVVSLPDRVPDHADRLSTEIASLGIPVHFILSPLWINVADDTALTKSLLGELAVVDQLQALIDNEGIDIVYTNTITRISGAIAAARAGKPHLYHVREVLRDHPLRSLLDIDSTFRLIARFADAVITNSCAVAKQFDPADVRDKLHVVYNAVDPEFFARPSTPGKLRRELALEPDAKLIGIIGTIHPHKNHEDLIRAFTIVKDRRVNVRLIVAGDSFCDYKGRLEEMIRQAGIEDRVHFLGFRSDIADLVHDLDLVVIASLAEPFGRTTIEAMAAGKPVVATNTGASPEIVLDGVTGRLVSLHDHQQMAEAIVEILADPELAGKMGRAGRDRAEAEFSSEKYVANVQNVLMNLAVVNGKKDETPTTIAARAMEIVAAEDLHRFVRHLLADWDQFVDEMTLLLPSRDDHLLRMRRLFEEYKTLYRGKYVEAEGVYIRLDREQRNNEVLQQQLKESELRYAGLENLMRQRLEESELRCAELEHSLSWRVTQPLRRMIDLFLKK